VTINAILGKVEEPHIAVEICRQGVFHSDDVGFGIQLLGTFQDGAKL
jgi:hypothetical protein